MRPLTAWGFEVMTKLRERNMTDEELTRAIGAPHASHIRDMFYGTRPGRKYVHRIEEYLGMDTKREA